MKKYIKASSYWLELDETMRNDLLNTYLKLFTDEGFEMEVVRNDSSHLALDVVSVDGDSSIVYDGYPLANGYIMNMDPFFSPDLHYLHEEDISESECKKHVDSYIRRWEHLYDKLIKLTDKMSEVELEVSQIGTEFKQKYANQFPDLLIHAEILPWFPADEKRPYPILYQWDDDINILITGTAAGEPYGIKYSYGDWESGKAEVDLVKQLSRIYKSKARGKSGNGELVAILKEHGIDTTKAKYELFAETYERYERGKRYTKSFTCAGDYLAYFAMSMHTTPNYNNIVDYYGDIYEFEAFVDKYPTVQDIKRHASESWWGDGDDYILSLTNLSNGKVLYENDDSEYYEEDEGDGFDDYDE